MQLCELKTLDAVAMFEGILDAALQSLLRDLAAMPWYVRERQVVNLFVFHHLVPRFRDAKLDDGHIGTEVPVWVDPEEDDSRLATSADIAIWPHSKATNWLTCKPFAWVEWKNCSCRESIDTSAQKQHGDDIKKLTRNRQASLLRYAVFSKRQNQRVEIICTKVNDCGIEPFPSGRVYATDGTGDERPYVGKITDIWKRAQSCEICDSCKSTFQQELGLRS